MKNTIRTAKLVLMTALSLCAFSGCARHYVITLSNGTQIGANSRPHRQDGAYVFKDAEGHKSYVPAGRVTLIEPASEAKQKKSNFNFLPSGQ